MNTKMYENSLTQHNLERLKNLLGDYRTAWSCSSLRRSWDWRSSWCQYYYRKSKGTINEKTILVSQPYLFCYYVASRVSLFLIYYRFRIKLTFIIHIPVSLSLVPSTDRELSCSLSSDGSNRWIFNTVVLLTSYLQSFRNVKYQFAMIVPRMSGRKT